MPQVAQGSEAHSAAGERPPRLAGLKRGGWEAVGPVPTREAISPPSAARALVMKITLRQLAPPSPLTRCGSADPSVSAPTMTPSAVPRPVRNHADIALRAGGYTRASAAPVSARRPAARVGPPAHNSPRFAPAAISAPVRISRWGETRSARLSAALSTAPNTNPSCTARVSPEAAASVSLHTTRSCGSTATAENHGAIARTTANASPASADQRPGAASWRERAMRGSIGGYVDVCQSALVLYCLWTNNPPWCGPRVRVQL